jgi:hypothetical protein
MSLKTPEISYVGDPLILNPDTEENIEFFATNLKPYYEKMPEFLEYHSSFPRTGKQGELGLLSKKDDNKKTRYVYKISQYLNFLINHEHSVLEGLNEIRNYCPHFCKTYGKFKTRINTNYRTEDNPFEYEDDNYIESDVLVMEYVDDGRKLYRYIKNDKVNPEIIMSIVKQTLISNIIAGEHTKFSHYDMHSNNVLIKKCKPNTAFFYILDDNRTYLVPTYGYYPVVIDFGFSFSKNNEGKPISSALAHTNVGFITSNYDQNADAKLFLTSVSHEMYKYKDSDISKQFRALVKNIYKNCNIDLECGWDDREDTPSISDYILKKMSHQFKRSKFFKNQGHHIVDLLQALVDLPVYKRKTDDDIDDLAGILVTEFYKIEREISSDFYNMYIIKKMIESVIKNREIYMEKTTRELAVSNFRKDILDTIDSLVNFCNPKINWEKLLCCMLCLSKCIENICHEKLKKLMSIKKSDYNNMRLKNTTEIYESIEANIPSHFVFDKETIIYIWDCVQQKSYKMNLNHSLITNLNETHPFERGTILYEYISSKDY